MEYSEFHLYRVNEHNGKFEVSNHSGTVVLVCENEASANNYAVLLSEAYQRGYKTGYGDGKKSALRERKS
jgi:hypothetical protein